MMRLLINDKSFDPLGSSTLTRWDEAQLQLLNIPI
jgi:hypothetical protein